jgi:hypothetical protein
MICIRPPTRWPFISGVEIANVLGNLTTAANIYKSGEGKSTRVKASVRRRSHAVLRSCGAAREIVLPRLYMRPVICRCDPIGHLHGIDVDFKSLRCLIGRKRSERNRTGLDFAPFRRPPNRRIIGEKMLNA